MKFIKGPLPINWFSVAAKLGGKALNLSLALFYKDGFRPGEEIVVSQGLLDPFDCGVRQTQHKTLQRLEKAGLVAVSRRSGASPRVKLILSSEAVIGVANEEH